MNHKCFVVMPIGTQTIGDITITKDQLREKYDYIIKHAITVADPTLEVTRSDEEIDPASISNDIFKKLMHYEYVVVDITYPNPNVFYELGIRHAISQKTILIREKTDLPIPFDISHLRYIEYTQDAQGMGKLSTAIKQRFEFYDENPEKPDNQFLELAAAMDYVPVFYKDISLNNADNQKEKAIIDLISMCVANPKLIDALINDNLSKNEQQAIMLKELGKNPDTTKQFFSTLIKSGLFNIEDL